MTLRELANNPKLLDKYSSVEIFDKRKKERRGIYLSELEAKRYREFAKKKLSSLQKKDIKDGILPDFFGIGTGEVGDLTKEEEKTIRYKKYM